MIENEIIFQERILKPICLIRGKKVMIDNELAKLYGVETKRLNEQAKRWKIYNLQNHS